MNPQISSTRVDTLFEATLPSLGAPSPNPAGPAPLDPPPVHMALADADQGSPLPQPKSLNDLVGRYSLASAVDDEQECLAAAVYFESKGEPLEGQLAVARTIMNRASSGRFAHGICAVIRQRGQFSFMHGSGAFPAVHREARSWRTAMAIARIAMDDLWAGPVRNALYFHAKHVAPGWKMVRLASVGNQVFYR